MASPFIHRFTAARAPGQPTLLTLHGTGGNEHDLVPMAETVSPQAAVLSPRGRVLEHGMPRFFRRLAEGIFDLEDLQAQTRELADFVVWAATEYRFDPASVYALGYSNGANIAASVLLSRPGLLAGAVLIRPMIPFEPAAPPALAGTAVLLLAGTRDLIVPAASTERLAALLRACDADVTLAWQDSGHHVTASELALAARWLVQHAKQS